MLRGKLFRRGRFKYSCSQFRPFSQLLVEVCPVEVIATDDEAGLVHSLGESRAEKTDADETNVLIRGVHTFALAGRRPLVKMHAVADH